ncbi:hypothetical protein M8C21_031795 [Ambrosia artemisiifolia]|uniref:PI4-kinase N-terminal domain-containing protein n=1 Tax=Ambrosia artemisiifolia TaxID=4212 RepID=A0AAD5C4W8_AMBAR|nr:hypothetical protein M8C21_031795 [Ambrosia artemisiifolia]
MRSVVNKADTWRSRQEAMFEGVLKSSCEIVKYGWTKDPHKGLAANIRKQNDCAEEVGNDLHSLHIRF